MIPLRVDVADHRHQQAAFGVDGDADVDALLVDDLVVRHVDRRIELREPLEGAGDDLQRDGRHRQLAARLLGLRSVLLAQRLELGDVGLVVLRDVRDRLPGVAEMLRRLAADVGHRLAFDFAPFREVGQRLCGAATPAPAVAPPVTRHHAADVRLHVFGTDASAGAAARDTRDVDARARAPGVGPTAPLVRPRAAHRMVPRLPPEPVAGGRHG